MRLRASRIAVGLALIVGVVGGGVARAADAPIAANNVAGAPGVDVRDKLVTQVNATLMAASRNNQCAFRKDSDVLLPGCEKKLKNLANALLAAKKKLGQGGVITFKFEVFGHTDSDGAPDFLRELSERRASTIAREMTGYGILPTEILSFGLAASKPLVTPADTPAKKAKNQRYEVQIKS
jgi:outer membrane protein OmpA-like peptidoglycan-associated protein